MKTDFRTGFLIGFMFGLTTMAVVFAVLLVEVPPVVGYVITGAIFTALILHGSWYLWDETEQRVKNRNISNYKNRNEINENEL